MKTDNKPLYQYTDIEWDALTPEQRDDIDMQSGIQGPPFAYHSNCWQIKTSQALAAGLVVPIEAIRRLAQTYGDGIRFGGAPAPENYEQWCVNQRNILQVYIERGSEEGGCFMVREYVENCINHDSPHSFDKILHLDKAIGGKALYVRYYTLWATRVGEITRQAARPNMEHDLAYFDYCIAQAGPVYDTIIALATWETAKRGAYYVGKENLAGKDKAELEADFRDAVNDLGPRPILLWPYKSFKDTLVSA